MFDSPDPDRHGDDGATILPTSMADLFLALVAVVVIMLLSMAPAIRHPDLLKASAPAELWQMDLRIAGERPIVLAARADGLLVAGDGEMQVPLDRILDDQALAGRIGAGREAGREILLIVEPEGGEAAFLFSALAGGLGLQEFTQLRIDSGCDFALADDLRSLCRRGAVAR